MTIFHASHQKNNYNFIVMRISISTDSTVVHFITSLYLCSQKEESQLNRVLCYVIPCFPLEYTISRKAMNVTDRIPIEARNVLIIIFRSDH